MKDLINEINDSGLIDELVDEMNILEILPVYNSLLNCKNCKGLKECKNPSSGYKVLKNGYKKCDYRLKIEESERLDRNLESLFFSKKSLEANLASFEISNQSRSDALSAVTNILNNNLNKGMFISGKNTAGKTYLLSSIANEYKVRGKKVIISFVPDLIRHLRILKFNPEIEDIIYELKNVDVLMLDDLGMEIFDSWFSTEILTPVLNYRLQEEKNTFFSSNYNLEELLKNSPKESIQDYFRLFRRIYSLVLKNKDKWYFEIERWYIWSYL